MGRINITLTMDPRLGGELWQSTLGARLGWGGRHFIGKIVQIESEFSVFPLSPLIKCISVKLLHNNKIPGTHHITPYISNIFPLT